jgi:hypothetical protein
MGHYTANIRDIEFCLFDLLERDKVLGTSIYSELDRETIMGMLEEIKRLSENELAASFVEGDRLGVEFNSTSGDVTLPESFKKSYRAYMDGEWWGGAGRTRRDDNSSVGSLGNCRDGSRFQSCGAHLCICGRFRTSGLLPGQ